MHILRLMARCVTAHFLESMGTRDVGVRFDVPVGNERTNERTKGRREAGEAEEEME